MKDSAVPPNTLEESGHNTPMGSAPSWLQWEFRPFFLAVALYGTILWWTWSLGDSGWVRDLEWVFGFPLVAIAGFLLLDVRACPGRDTWHGGALFGLALWLTGRVVVFFMHDNIDAEMLHLANLAFPITLLIVLTRTTADKSWRFFGILTFVGLLTLCSASVISIGSRPEQAFNFESVVRRLEAAAQLVVLLILLPCRRMICDLTGEASRRRKLWQRPILDDIANSATAISALFLFLGHRPLSFLFLALAGGSNMLRMILWSSREAFRNPVVRVLLIGIAWTSVSQLVLAYYYSPYGSSLGALGMFMGVGMGNGMNLLMICGVGAMTLGMMVRVSLERTGRPLAPSALMRTAFTLISASPLLGLLSPLTANGAHILAGVTYSAAFLFFLIAFTPILLGASTGDGSSRGVNSITRRDPSKLQSPHGGSPLNLVDGTHSTSAARGITPAAYVSYAWGEDSTVNGRRREELVNQLCVAVESSGRVIGRDKTRLRGGDSIERFADEISKARRIVAVISEKSLHSEFCMAHELFRAYRRCDYRRAEFQEKVIALVMDDAKPLLENRHAVVALARSWQERLEKLRSELQEVDPKRKSSEPWMFVDLMEEMCPRLPAMMAALQDIVMKRGFEEIVNDGFQEVISLLPPVADD